MDKADTAMSNENIEYLSESRADWERLDEWARRKVQGFVQMAQEEEITEFLGRKRSERRSAVDGKSGCRNGYGKPRRLTPSSRTIRVSRPRIRNAEERFENRVLPLFTRRSKKVTELIPELYLHGLVPTTSGRLRPGFAGLLGDDTPISASAVSRLKEKWRAELGEWRQRPLNDLEVAYPWVDGVYVKAGLEKDKAAILVVLAALSDGRKVIVTAVPGNRESTESWSDTLRDFKRRGMDCPRLEVGDGHVGFWGALRKVYPQVAEQRCWNHKIVNVLGRTGKTDHAQAKLILCRIPYAETRKEAERLKTWFLAWRSERGYQAAAETLGRDCERMMTFYQFPKEHWQHLRTADPVESPFAALRVRTDAVKRYKKVDRATAVIWKMLMIAEK